LHLNLQEPYRPPTDPALMTAFLEAAREGASWQARLPELHDVERAACAVLATGAQYDAMLVEGPLNGGGGAAGASGHPFFLGRRGGRVAPAPVASASGSASGGPDGTYGEEDEEVSESVDTFTADSAPEVQSAGGGVRTQPQRTRLQRHEGAESDEVMSESRSACTSTSDDDIEGPADSADEVCDGVAVPPGARGSVSLLTGESCIRARRSGTKRLAARPRPSGQDDGGHADWEGKVVKDGAREAMVA
jgi:hypothetical protein